ncbi:cytochrome c oxidase accessory protein CcoG [Methylobacillus gramineus]|uniref:cytochrome c oxidase accessory protein CcoG n=1 Tax=Methylobacillus gramineus TaxID=755169 RepID=UPI001CFFAB08|nr:cytochrome c oxidase accessory protein CcoG [Methylobacillus gramineus]MCB5183868.1 cytochrome c oxidase accessory protein CcoG [Methylobacillus gramineus]
MQAEATVSTRNTVRRIIPIVPYSVKGRYRNIKSIILNAAFAVYFLLPWLRWNNDSGTGQAILLDIQNSRFYIFNLVLYPQDLMVLLGIMVFAAILLFVSAAMFGRIFCGFFCFQTLWTDAFRFIEKWIQGEAQAQKRLSNAPWSVKKMALLGSTHALWLLLSFATALTFTLYFANAHTLLGAIFTGQAAIAAYITISVLTATTYVAAGFAREDVCFVACPYGKFQGVMQDASTVTVIYDQARGEGMKGRQAPTTQLKTPQARQDQGFGDCIDCNYCVNVCPTGVDIRKGFQIGCISCGLCVDACNNIMDSIKLPRGLIRFDRDENIKEVDQDMKRWSIIKRASYISLLAASGLFTWHIASSLEPYTVIVQQERQPLVTQLSDGSLRNRYQVRITNKTAEPETYHIHSSGLPDNSFKGWKHIAVPAGKSYTSDFSVSLPPGMGTNHFSLTITPHKQPEAAHKLRVSFFAK